MKYSIVIPTYNHCEDLLKPCIDSIFKYTTMSNVELIVSANGCTDNTKEYLENLYQKFREIGFEEHLKVVWHDEPLGYSRATNEGIKVSTCDYIVLLNNDTILLPQEKNLWLDCLVNPFQVNLKCGIASVVNSYSEPAGRFFAIFFCVMIHRKVFNKIGLLNQDYGVGGSEDIEFCIEAERAGFEVHQCMDIRLPEGSDIYTGSFPIYHKGEGTVLDETLVTGWNDIFLKNSLKLAKKYNPEWYHMTLKRYPNINNTLVDFEYLKSIEPMTYTEVFELNTYAVEKNDIKDKVVIDIGANLGLFTLLCVDYEASKVISVEPEPTIYSLGLVPNVQSYKQVVPVNLAVYSKNGTANIRNVHVSSKISEQDEGTPIETVTLESLVNLYVPDETDMVLKMDCEGSEFDIFCDSNTDVLKKFNTIFIEIHNDTNPKYRDGEVIRKVFAEAGFTRVYSEVQNLYLDSNGNCLVEKWIRV